MSPEGLAATLERYREDDLPNRLQVRLDNRSGVVITLDSLRLRWPGLTEQPPSEKVHVVQPGQLVDLPVAAGTAVCSDPPALDEALPTAPAVALARVAFGAAAPLEVEIPVTDVQGALARVFVPGCRRQAIFHAVDVSFGPTFTHTTVGGRPAVAATLELRRNADDRAMELWEVRRSVLLSIARAEPGDGPWGGLAAGEAEASIPVVLTQSGNCEPHALAESKHTFFLPAAISLDGADPVLVDLVPGPDAQVQLLGMINRACGVGG